jgi:two-component system sensor histidine kinase RstB
MLTYARLDRPELPLQCSDLELGSWAGSRLADWQALRPDKRLDFVRPAMALPWRGDTGAGPGAGEPHRQRPAPCHQPGKPLHSATQDDYLLEVADDGPGIDPALAPQIFEPFVRLDQSRTDAPAAPGWGWPSCAASPATTAARCNCCQAAAVPVSA